MAQDPQILLVGTSQLANDSQPEHAALNLAAKKKRRTRLNYLRTSVACDQCRQRKTRCIPSPDDIHDRCSWCIRKNLKCNFYPVDRHPPPDNRKNSTSRSSAAGLGQAAKAPRLSSNEAGGNIRAITSNHTTPRGLLLTWPTICERVKLLLQEQGIKNVLEYPICQEEQRGHIRTHGRGEGFNQTIHKTESGPSSQPASSAMQHKAINLENNSSSGGSYDEGSELVRYPGAIWGQLGGWGDHNIKLDLEPKTVWMYVKSYEQNIQNMHPLICPEPLHAMANLFLATLPCASPSQAAFAGTFDLPKTSTGSTPIAPTMPLRPGMPFRNVESALVLSILALGKICLHKHARLPNVLPENLEQPESPPPGGWQRSRPSPAHGDFGISSSNSFVNNDEYSPAPSFQDSPLVSPMRRNLDEIPGLDYFTAACEIMASHPAGRELNYVWVHILASLYYGQLGRPIDSLESVARAGRLLLAMMLPSMSRYESIHDTLMEYSSKYEFGERVQVPESENVQHPDNPYLVAYWSCVQLESDILAELRFPPSGILPYEKHIPYPRLDLLVMHGIEQRVLESYMAQLYLRKQLNDIHKTLCHSDIDGAPNSKQIEIYSTILSPHSWAPVQYAFEDTDPPPDEILHARLRAKYWGAQVIVHMFYVRRILDHNFNQRAKREERRRKREENGHNGDESNDDKEYITMGKVDEDVARVLHPSIRNPHQVSRPAPRYPVDPNTPREQQFGPDKLLIDVDTGSFSPISITLARRGIQALIESTRAFHSLPDRRFIITDVFGTAHTQWGNLLILDSIQRDPVLGRYISGELVNDLFCKTIDFFEIVSQPSSALGYDLRILKGLYAMRMRESVCNGQAQDPGPP